MTTAILFDMDGTLLDTLQDLADAVNYTLQELGCPERTLEEVRRFVGDGARLLLRRALPVSWTDEAVEQVYPVFQKHYNACCRAKVHPYPGIPEALAALQGRYPIGIVTNKPMAAARMLGEQFFPGIYVLGEDPSCPKKPAPDMVQKALRELGAEGCIYIGDSEVDVVTAKNAGAIPLSVLWGFRDSAQLTAAGAKNFCDDPTQLPRIIETLISKNQ